MLKDDNKYVQVKLSKDEDARIAEKARELHLSKSALIGAIIAGALSYESGKAIGEAFGKFLFGGGSDGK